MKLSSLFKPELVLLSQNVSTVEEAVEKLIDAMAREFSAEVKKTQALSAVQERLKLGHTLFDTGLCVPHARLDGLEDIILGVLVPSKPMSADGKAVTMVVLILTGKTHSKIYLNTLSALVSVSQDQALYKKLAGAPNAHAFMETVDRIDLRVKKDISVADIMTPEVHSVKPSATLREILDLCYQYNISYAPVVNDKDEFIGEVTLLDIMKIGLPNYATMIGNLNFLTTFEPFEDLLRREDQVTAKDIMRKPSPVCSPATSVIEAALEMTQHSRRHLGVVEAKKVIGVVSYMDILKKVLRG